MNAYIYIQQNVHIPPSGIKAVEWNAAEGA